MCVYFCHQLAPSDHVPAGSGWVNGRRRPKRPKLPSQPITLVRRAVSAALAAQRADLGWVRAVLDMPMCFQDCLSKQPGSQACSLRGSPWPFLAIKWAVLFLSGLLEPILWLPRAASCTSPEPHHISRPATLTRRGLQPLSMASSSPH